MEPTRRELLALGGTALALAPLGARSAAAAAPPPPGVSSPRARPPAAHGAADAPSIAEATIADLAAALRDGRHTARSLVLACHARIDALDQRGPTVNAILELDPDALAEADRLDGERRAGRVRGPLHGIPILLKDNVEATGRTSTTAGSHALDGYRPRRDAFLVARLRAAGAVLLGKTNLSEWANFRSDYASSGWSGRGGPTRNPHVLDRSPSGSSSGSAAAVAAGFCPAAVGTETDGSILAPASACGVVGIKPTLGLVSRGGVVPLAHSQDTAGPIARTVADAAVLLSAMAGVDPADPAAAEARGRVAPDYTRFLDPAGLRGARLAVVRAPAFHLSPDCDPLLDAVVATLRERGATVEDRVDVESLAKIGDPELEVLLHELKADLDRYLAAAAPPSGVRSLADVIAWNRAHADVELPLFGQDLFERSAATAGLAAPRYKDALALSKRLARAEGIDDALRRHRADALVAVTAGPAWAIDLVAGDHATGGSTTLAAVAGYPSITVPAGMVRGLPVGVSFFGAAFSEPTLVKLAFAYEQASRARRPPAFLPTVALPAAALRRSAAPAR